jgi:ketosteroid isomerase-like protein
MDGLSLEQRLDRLESRALIAELGSAYAVACDERDMERLLDTFAPDAAIRSVNGVMNARGREHISAMFERMFAVRGPAYHWTHDRFVWFDDDDSDRATGQVLAHAETTLHGVASLAALRYDDNYVRIGDTWKFSERVLSFLYYVPLKDYLDRIPKIERFHNQGTYSAADFPEALPTWQRFYATDRSVS